MVVENTLKFWDDIVEGEGLPAVHLNISYERVILDAAATQDYFPGHHNPDYAKHQGQKNIYLNTMAIEGFLDRIVTDWAGPHTFIRKRQMQMRASIYAGDTIVGQGRVERRYEENGLSLVDLSVTISNQDGLCVPASFVIALPRAQTD
jgi:acyl dehydratase